MNQIELDDIKQIEFDILVHFARQCEQNNLRYYLSAGTLLGAIRHKGFIPWDDDIDVMMPREDYERYFELFPSINDQPHLSLTSYRDKTSIYPFFKLVDNRTVVYEQYVDKKYCTGVWVDIFPLDGTPNDEPFKAHEKTHRLYDIITADPSAGTSTARKIIKRVLKPLFAHRDIYKEAAKLDQTAASNPIIEGEPFGQVVWGYGPCEKMTYDFIDAIDVEFEGEVFKAPRIYDAYLSALFGDYMTPPPESERIPHNFQAFWKDDK